MGIEYTGHGNRPRESAAIRRNFFSIHMPDAFTDRFDGTKRSSVNTSGDQKASAMISIQRHTSHDQLSSIPVSIGATTNRFARRGT